MTTVTRSHRIYFAAVGLLAVWVGLWGYLMPTLINWAIPWLVPPLHARFIGAVYLSATAFCLGALLARRYAEVRATILVIGIWTGMLLIVSLFYLDTFVFSNPPVWFWFGAYILYPLIAAWLTWRDPGFRASMDKPGLPAWVQRYLMAQGVLFTLLGLALLFFPDFMASLWPWKIGRMLAQIYSAPFLAYGLGSLMISRQASWPEARIIVISAFVLAATALLASFLHIGLFSFGNLSTIVWFAVFGAATVILGLLSVQAVRAGGGA